MTQASVTASDVALQVVQQAVSVLAKWADAKLPPEGTFADEYPVVKRVKKDILPWSDGAEPQPLQLLFDQVKLDKKKENQKHADHYWPVEAIANEHPTIPYPQSEPSAPEQINNLKQAIQQTLNQLDDADWKNLSLLTLILEKFGSYISFDSPDVALIDTVATTAAVAAALANNPASTHLTLVSGKLSGIQNFIYTISSDGALKSLRARSFYLELVTEEVVQQLLTALNLPRTNVIYAGGGNLYILADDTEQKQTKDVVYQVGKQFNQWFLDNFQGKLFLSIDYCSFSIEDITTDKFAIHWSNANTQLANQKYHKLADQIEQLTKFIQSHDSYEPCRICHRDDVKILKRLNNRDLDSVLACDTCYNMFHLGSWLPKVTAIMRSRQEQVAGALHTISFKLPAKAQRPAIDIYYHLFSSWKQIVRESETVFLVNDWTVEHYQFRHFRNPVLMLLGNYGQHSQEIGEDSEEPVGFMRANEMAKAAQGIPRVGYLQMDVDRLGQIFAKGLGKNQTLPRLAALSRQMSYFFNVYLNSLAEKRKDNLPESAKCLTRDLSQNPCPRPNLLFIYAGGDDLFISGTWNEIVEFAFDVYQSFRAYTGINPDITLSAGISLSEPKFPIYLAARESRKAEKAAKGNDRDSLGLFGEVFKWDEWLGIEDIAVIDKEIINYLSPEAVPNLLGVFPFVKELQNQVEISYSRSFVRNLLLTADLQKQMIKKIKDKPLEQQRDIRYYLHLPKVAYTLARLPAHVRNAQSFEPVRTSLKSPYNAPYFRAIATWIELLSRS